MLPLLLLAACANSDLNTAMDMVRLRIVSHPNAVMLPDPIEQHLPDFQGFHITTITGSGHGGNLTLLHLSCTDQQTLQCWRVRYNGPSIANRNPIDPTILETGMLVLHDARPALTAVAILNQSRFEPPTPEDDFTDIVNEKGERIVTGSSRRITFSTANYALWLDVGWRGYHGRRHAFCDYPSSEDIADTFLPNAQNRLLQAALTSVTWTRVTHPTSADRDRFDDMMRNIIHCYQDDKSWWWPLTRSLTIATELGSEALLEDIARIAPKEDDASGERIRKLMAEADRRIRDRSSAAPAR